MESAHDVKISFCPASGSSVYALDLGTGMLRGGRLTVAVCVCRISFYKCGQFKHLGAERYVGAY